MPGTRTQAPWWQRADLARDGSGALTLGGEVLSDLASTLGVPLFAHSAARISDNLARLRSALERTERPFRVFYAMKANRFVPLLAHLRSTRQCGIDACSPAEVALARSVGFAETDISYTATSVSRDDLERVLGFRGVQLNVDSLSCLRAVAARAPGRSIGLRIDPAVGVGYRDNDLLEYAGSSVTKFGIPADALDLVVDIARAGSLTIDTLHVHAGCGYLGPQLDSWERVLQALDPFLERLPEVRAVNVGGGLGIALTAHDRALDLDAWSAILRRRFADRELQLQVEPGTFLVKDAGVLVVEVTHDEVKRGVRFVGVNAGFNIHVEPAVYRLPLEVVPLRSPPSGEAWSAATIAGNINEALDVWARDVQLPPLAPGDRLALLNAGAYGSSMSSNHCMRGTFAECLIAEPDRRSAWGSDAQGRPTQDQR
jgi:diaminopimelate decarboxylase